VRPGRGPAAWAPALALAVALAGAASLRALPASVAGELPALEAAERRLEDATLALAAARREAQGPQEAVAEARAQSDSWWGPWLLRHRLAQLKARLDRVEAARQAQVEAHATVFTLLSGLEEQLRASLEASLASGAKAGLAGDWRQEQAWRQRVEALEQGVDENPGAGPQERRLLVEARLEQLRRDQRLVAALRARGLLGVAEARQAQAALQASQAAWQARSGR
jgi:hypothetical protein